jgi:divalent metal cation (Fe/Co/Zn/Cd) transporter
MSDRQPSNDALREGARVSWISVGWTTVAGSVALSAGVARGSLVLIVFALTGFLDAAGSLTLALHFRHALKHERISVERERLALRLVSIGLIALGMFTAVESTRRLVSGANAERSALGIIIAGASIGVLVWLAWRKKAVAPRVPSNALSADGTLSATGAALAVVALLGTAFSSSKELHWVDPAAALVVAVVAAASGIRALRAEEVSLEG